MRIRRSILVVVLLAGAWPCAATPEPVPEKKTPTKSPAEIVARQRQILSQLRELESRLAKLATTLEATEPDKAQRLTTALRESGQRRIAPRLAKIVTALEQNAWGDAEYEQELLLKDLEALLNVLSEARDNLDELQVQRERLRQQRESLAQMYQQQLELRMELQSRDEAQAMARKLGELADNLGRLAERQEATTGENDAKTQDDLEAVAEAMQRQLAEQHEQTPDPDQQRALETAEAATQAAQKAMHAALEQMQPSGGNATPPANGSNSKPSEQSSDASGSQPQEQQPANSSPSESQPSEGARLAQQQAGEQLRNAEAALRQSAQQPQSEEELRRIERLQRDLQSQADQMHQQMRPRSESQGNQPGAEQTGRAAEHMQQAADALSEEDSPSAQGEQDDALAQLQKALDELDEALRQVRREERAEMLAGIESRLRVIINLENQVHDAVAAATKRLVVGELPSLDEPEKLHAQALEESEALHRLLISEGSVVVLPNLLAYILSDMRTVQPMLGAEELSPAVEVRLENIITQLEQLLDAVSKQREHDQEAQADQQQQQNQQNGPQDAQPLMQRSAELKLLRTAQLSINERSNSLDEGPVQKELATMLSERQTELADLTLRLIETE